MTYLIDKMIYCDSDNEGLPIKDRDEEIKQETHGL